MRTIALLAILVLYTGQCFRVVRGITIRLRSRNELGPWRFAALFAAAIGVLVFGMFFISMVSSPPALTASSTLIGLGITAINALLAYPVGLVAYRLFSIEGEGSPAEGRNPSRRE